METGNISLPLIACQERKSKILKILITLIYVGMYTRVWCEKNYTQSLPGIDRIGNIPLELVSEMTFVLVLGMIFFSHIRLYYSKYQKNFCQSLFVERKWSGKSAAWLNSSSEFSNHTLTTLKSWVCKNNIWWQKIDNCNCSLVIFFWNSRFSTFIKSLYHD